MLLQAQRTIWSGFARAEEFLTSKGYSVVNPAKVNAQLPSDTSYEDYMKMSFCMLESCDSIYMLNGWEKSNGANMEFDRAKELMMTMYFETTKNLMK